MVAEKFIDFHTVVNKKLIFLNKVVNTAIISHSKSKNVRKTQELTIFPLLFFQGEKEITKPPIMGAVDSELFCLKWNDFQTSLTTSFAELRAESDLLGKIP